MKKTEWILKGSSKRKGNLTAMTNLLQKFQKITVLRRKIFSGMYYKYATSGNVPVLVKRGPEDGNTDSLCSDRI